MTDRLISELIRRLKGLVQTGVIMEADHTGYKARVKIGQLETDFLPILTTAAAQVRSVTPLALGEQVLIISPMGDSAQGIILRGLFYDQNPKPETAETEHAIHYPDGAVISYDHETHELKAQLPDNSSALVKATSITLDVEELTVTGKATFKDEATFEALVTAKAEIDVANEATINGIKFTEHFHDKVAAGTAKTGEPQ